ncbi:alpha/beta hydrolase family protein [Sphingomonas faeni]|uniref:alpha/beta hydrolase family protein n=1 Tax=Sphingomonas faeni TaxID=185950 RepID=UPI003364C785
MALAKQGISTLRFDFAGIGTSDGRFADTSFAADVRDLVAAGGAMAQADMPPTLLVGHSLGGAAALAAAGDMATVRAVATIGAPADVAHVLHQFGSQCLLDIEETGAAEVMLANRPFTVGRTFVEDARSHDLSAKIAGLRRPLLVLHARNAGTLYLSPRFWGQAGSLRGRRTSTIYSGGAGGMQEHSGGAGGMQEQQIARLDRLTVGGAQFRGVPVELENANAVHGDLSQALDGNLGIGVLSRFHLIVDFPHARVLFAPPVDQARPFPVDHVGLTVRPDKAGLTVVHVARGSPAALIGLSVGDVITTVDGTPKNALTNSSWRYGIIGNTVRFRMLDSRQVNLKYGEYF